MVEWRNISGYEGYYRINNYGDVKSLKRTIYMKHKNRSYYMTIKEKMLKQNKDSKGYYMVNLYKDGNKKSFTIHKLMGITFLGNKPNGKQDIVVDHKDNNKENNNLNNLQLITGRLNVTKDKPRKCKYIGVSKNISSRTGIQYGYRSRININKKEVVLGYFDTQEKARDAYQLALSKIDCFENEKQFQKLINKYVSK